MVALTVGKAVLGGSAPPGHLDIGSDAGLAEM